MVDYSKWKNIEISDDEDDTHPNIDTPSLFRWRHQARLERMAEFQHEKDECERLYAEHTLIQSKMTQRRGLTNEELKNFLEESDDEYMDFDDEIDDPNFQDPAHNLQYSSDSDECEMDIEHDIIPQNAKNSDALSDTDTASLSSVDERPSANASGCRPILWFHADSTFLPRMTIPAESFSSLLFNLNCSATKLDVFFKLFPKSLMIWISQCTNQQLKKLGQTIHPTYPSEIMLVLGCMLVMSYNKVPKFSHYWSSNLSLGNVAIKNAISRDRCKTLLSKLYFTEPEKPENASKTYYIDEVVSCLKQTFQQC
ncbi:hsp90 co-chaperone Cdc37 [Trichonephila inaurata madagascariensis]|uniref:Hsp90 co-chaperone Cdc37 n=1 Tax=Trichonephila inaurata madagascariensis TaxID=2747483 RepID=A0A8X6J5T6_9ARAC|nr:hsp90 co-chaperone Cdc37 [Trichonephila inaurata madagascariensis]